MIDQTTRDGFLPCATRNRRPCNPAKWRKLRPVSVICRRLVAVSLLTHFVAGAAPPARATGLDLTLSDALRLARENAFAVKASYHDSLAAEYGLRTAKSAWLPNLGLSANALAFHPFDPLQLGLLQLDKEWQQVYMGNLQLSYPIYTGGRRRSEVRLNKENVGAAASDLSTSKLANAYECRQAYIGLLIADRVVRATEKSLERVEIINNDTENLYSAGLADSIDILETQLSLRQIRRQLEEVRTQRRNASAMLARFLGVGGDVVIVPGEPIPTPRLEEGTVPGGASVADRPELAALDHRILAAGHQRSLVKGNLLPVISGAGGYALVRPEVGDIGGEWHDIGWVRLTLAWDLNLGRGESAAADQALEKMHYLEMQRKDLERKLTLQAQVAWNDMQKAYTLSQIRGEEFNLAKRRFRLAEEKRTVGQMSANRFLELEAELTETEQQFEVARLRFFAARTDYLYATGSDELWEGF